MQILGYKNPFRALWVLTLRKYTTFFLGLSLALTVSIATAETEALRQVTNIPFKIIAERTHKTSLFTQGLFIKGNRFYESSGLYGKSLLVSYPIAEPEGNWAKLTAPFSQKQTLPDNYFAEGLTILHNKLYLLTWQEQSVFVYDANTFSFLKNLSYQGEGWGLATDGKYLIRSDGSQHLFFHHSETFAVEKTLDVKLKQQPISHINELEFAEGFIWANIWHKNQIVKIDPTSGNIVGFIDLSQVAKSLALKNSESVLNGIAYDADKKAFWVTGKQWPKMFLVKLI